MSYLGSSATPIPVAFSGVRTQSLSGTGLVSLFTLTRQVQAVTDIEVVVNNVQQSPFDGSYSIVNNGLGLQFSENPSAGTNNIYVVYRDQPLGSLYDTGAVRKTGDTGAAQMPVGTTAQRPVAPIAGHYRLNSTTGNPEWYSAALESWIPFSTIAQYTIEYLIVAGGGSGNNGYINDNTSSGGGGGAGGLLSGSISVASSASFPIVVGAGGAYTYVQDPSASGNNSTFNSLSAIGGGGGGKQSRGGNGGGSGGGGGGGNGQSPGGTGTVGQGNAGAAGVVSNNTAGGGGGASAAATSWPGGAGFTSSISGSVATYATGGNGGYNGTGNGVAGTNNTGNGGTGSQQGSGAVGANGGSGVVIIRYLGSQKGFGGVVTSANGYTIHTFTSSGTFTA